MDISDLKSIISRGDLVSMNVSSEGTQKSFVQLIEIMANQEQEIEQLRTDLSNYLPVSDFEEFKKLYKIQSQKTTRSIAQVDQNLKYSITDMEAKNEALLQETHETMTAVVQTIDDRVESLISTMRDDVITLKEKSDDFETKMVALANQPAPEVKSYAAPTNKDQLQALQKRLLLLEKKLYDMESKVAYKEDIKATQSAVDLKIEEVVSSRLESSKTLSMIQTLAQSNNDPKTKKKEEIPIPEENSSLSAPLAPQSPLLSNDIPFESIAEDDPPPPDSIEGIRETISLLESKIDENNKVQHGKIDRKADLNIVEHMFERLRTIVASTKDEIASAEAKLTEFVTKNEMEDWIAKTLAQMNNEDKSIPFQTDSLTIATNAAKGSRPTQPKKMFKIKKNASQV